LYASYVDVGKGLVPFLRKVHKKRFSSVKDEKREFAFVVPPCFGLSAFFTAMQTTPRSRYEVVFLVYRVREKMA
jgi:hypothetical protein